MRNFAELMIVMISLIKYGHCVQWDKIKSLLKGTVNVISSHLVMPNYQLYPLNPSKQQYWRYRGFKDTFLKENPLSIVKYKEKTTINLQNFYFVELGIKITWNYVDTVPLHFICNFTFYKIMFLLVLLSYLHFTIHCDHLLCS